MILVEATYALNARLVHGMMALNLQHHMRIARLANQAFLGRKQGDQWLAKAVRKDITRDSNQKQNVISVQ